VDDTMAKSMAAGMLGYPGISKASFVCLWVHLRLAFISAYFKMVVLCTYLLITKPFLFIYLFLYLVKSYRSLIALIVPAIFIYFVYSLSQNV